MIGIVVVSHSRALARAAVGLVGQMGEPGSGPRIEVAAGLDDDALGTDATAVVEAVGRADDGDGVLVLVDLGSAVLSAEMALELLDPDQAARVRLSPAPLVEGLVVAAVAAGSGADLAGVAAEAERGLRAKQEHLGTADVEATAAQPAGREAGAPTAEGEAEAPAVLDVVLSGEHGLHARPAARLVRCVNGVPGVRVEVADLDSGRGPVDGRSLTALATLDARRGHTLRVIAAGPGAEVVLARLQELAERSFGDTPAPPPSRESAPAGGAGSGLEAAVGTVVRPAAPLELGGYRPAGAAEEERRLTAACATARAQLEELVGRAVTRAGAAEAAVFEAHLDLLADPELTDPVLDAVRRGTAAPQAWQRRVSELSRAFDALSDTYQRERAQDVRSVGERVLRALVGAPAEGETDPRGAGASGTGVLVVDELDPATAVTLDPRTTGAVVSLRGGATGHGVLIARARGIPVLPGAGPVADVPVGTVVALDARRGELVVDPDETTLQRYAALLETRRHDREEDRSRAGEPATTTDGRTVAVEANVGGVEEARQAAVAGADGSGLVRTEVLFGDRSEAPDVTDQATVLARVAEALAGRPVTVRTWDVGGDKPLPFLPRASGANPFLGVRGLRAFRADPTLLLDQLEAVCRVAVRHPVRVMFPMVTTTEEVDWALARLDEAAGRLAGGRPERLEVGVMVEVPGAALRAGPLARRLDFVSIGSNDLTQYALAADRGNPGVSALGDHADPAVLRLVRTVCREVGEGVVVAACGDAASEPDLAAVLVGLGVSELSATAATVPLVKARLRRSSHAELVDLANRTVAAGSAEEVRHLAAAAAPR